jgi:hypothetical protein
VAITAPDPVAPRTHLTGRELFELAEAYFVYDPTGAADTGAVARRLGRHDGVVCVEIPPRDSVPLGALALGILASLGKDLDREKQITKRDAWRLARVWLNAEEIQALIIIGADQLDVATWRHLSDVCRQSPPPSVILIQHQTGLDRTQRELLDRERTFTSVPPATFRTWGRRFEAACEHASRTDDTRVCAAKARFPSVPGDEIPYFRASCRATLSKPDFRVVDDTYRKGYDSTCRWLDIRDQLNEDDVGRFLAASLRGTDVNEQLTRLRGAQVAFLRHWWLLKVDIEALAAAHHVDSPIHIDAETHRQLRAYVQPKTSALAALAIVTGLPPGRLAMLNADQIYAGRRWQRAYDAIDLGDRKLAVPDASLFLQAHDVDRGLRDQPPDGPLFTTTAGERLTAAGVQQQLRRVTRDIGQPLVSSWSSAPAQQHGHWMRRRGLTLQPL